MKLEELKKKIEELTKINASNARPGYYEGFVELLKIQTERMNLFNTQQSGKYKASYAALLEQQGNGQFPGK